MSEYNLQNSTITTLLERRSIRQWSDEPIPNEVIETLQSVAQHAASSEFLNDWSAIRITDPEIAAQLAEIGNQPYIAQAPLLYVFVADEQRNMHIAQANGAEVTPDTVSFASSARFIQMHNDAILAMHAMETAAYSLGLGCVYLGSILNNTQKIIEILHLPKYTFPVLGLAIGKPAQEPTIKPRMQQSMQFFENRYPDIHDQQYVHQLDEHVAEFDERVHQYYDLRHADRPVAAFSDQIVKNAQKDLSPKCIATPAAQQGFQLNR